jgi:hypothetical protein
MIADKSPYHSLPAGNCSRNGAICGKVRESLFALIILERSRKWA